MDQVLFRERLFVGSFFTKDQLDELKRIPIESSIIIQEKYVEKSVLLGDMS
jgi:hypothetical protein